MFNIFWTPHKSHCSKNNTVSVQFQTFAAGLKIYKVVSLLCGSNNSHTHPQTIVVFHIELCHEPAPYTTPSPPVPKMSLQLHGYLLTSFQFKCFDFTSLLNTALACLKVNWGSTMFNAIFLKFYFKQCCGSGSGLFGSPGSRKILDPDPDPLSTKRPL